MGGTFHFVLWLGGKKNGHSYGLLGMQKKERLTKKVLLNAEKESRRGVGNLDVGRRGLVPTKSL